MRCRECGLELDARDRLPNGAYQCPECGAIHHTASSSKVSPSPWRRKRGNSFSSPTDALRERRFGLPLWSWLAIALAALIAIIVAIVLLTSRPDDSKSDMPAAEDHPVAEVTAEPGAELAEPIDGAEEALLNDAGAANSAPAANTGVAPNDFIVSFDWAMNRLNFTAASTLASTETSAAGEVIQNYTFADWCQLRLTLDPEGTVIRSATVTAQLAEGATDNTPVLAAFVSAIYGLDNTVSATGTRDEVAAMIADTSRTYQRDAFTATLSGTSPSYTLELTGKRTQA